jgi:hypothetical protein
MNSRQEERPKTSSTSDGQRSARLLGNRIQLKDNDLIDNSSCTVSELLAARMVGTHLYGKRIHCYLSIPKTKRFASRCSMFFVLRLKMDSGLSSG